MIPGRGVGVTITHNHGNLPGSRRSGTDYVQRDLICEEAKVYTTRSHGKSIIPYYSYLIYLRFSACQHRICVVLRDVAPLQYKMQTKPQQ